MLPPFPKEVIKMLAWLSANLINIVLIAVIALITGLVIRGMIRNKKAGKSSCGENCSSCGVCSGCSSCGRGNTISNPADTVTGSYTR